MKKVLYCLVMIMLLISVLLSCNCAYAAESLLNDELFKNDKTQCYHLSHSAKGGETFLTGEMFILPDGDNNTFAVCFNINETTLTQENNNIVLGVHVSENDTEYELYVGQKGIIDTDVKNEYVTAESFYSYQQDYHSFMALVKFKKPSAQRNIDIGIVVNGTRYPLTDNDSIDTLVIENDTATSTHKSTSESTKTKTTTKANQNITTGVSTKYTPKGEYSPTTQLYDSVSDDTVTISTTTEQSEKESEVKSMANSSKIMTATGAVVFAAGSVFVELGAIKHSKIAKQKTE